MKEKIDYEQLYYDVLYENKKLKNRVEELEIELQEINNCRTRKNINLQKYLKEEIKRYLGR